MLFPVLKGHFLFHIQIIDKLLRLYIKDNPNNVFFINHSPCAELLESLNENFPLSKSVFTIHDFGWTMPLMGSVENYRQIVMNNMLQEDKTESIFGTYKEERRMYESADRVICLSQDTHYILQDIYKIDKDKLYYVPNGIRGVSLSSLRKIDKMKTKLLLHLRGEDRILLFIGRPTKQKGVFDLVAAMDRVLKYFTNTKLVVIGDGNEVSMKEIINMSSRNISAIVYTGQLSKKEVRKWLAVADVGVIASYYEQCSYTAIEMMMYGLPIVASDGLGVRNMFQDGVNAEIAKIGNRQHPEEYQNNLANSILALLNSPDTCKVLGSNARKRYEEKYHTRFMKQKYNELIESL